MFELTHVAWPGILHHLLHGGGRKLDHLLAVAGAIAAEKVRGKQRDIFSAIAQRGQMNLDGVDAEEQVLAEVAGLGLFLQERIGGGENSDIDTPRLLVADALQLARLQHTKQLGLLAEGYVGDFVEEKSAAIGKLEAADAICTRISECALHVAENFAFEGSLGKASSVDGNKRSAGAGRSGVEELGDNLLAGTMLAGDEHVGVGGTDLRNQFKHGLHGRRAGDKLRHAFRAGRDGARRARE